jgi:hypothetical protein
VSDTSTKAAITNLDGDSVITEDDKPMLTEIGRRVLEHKNKIAARMIKQNKGIMFIFGRGDLVWLLFNIKLCLSTKPKKISCRILKRSYKIRFWFFLPFRFLLILLVGLYSYDLVGQDQGSLSS